MNKYYKYAATLIQISLIIVLALCIRGWSVYDSYIIPRWITTGLFSVLALLYLMLKKWELSVLFAVLALLKLPFERLKIQGMTHPEWNFIDISLIVFSIVLIILIWITDRKNPNSIQEAPKEIQKEK